jgi:hypothetical protein
MKNAKQELKPIIFLDMDDVMVTSVVFNGYQVIRSFDLGQSNTWPELWNGLVLNEARENLCLLHEEFLPHYVISSSWTSHLTRQQMIEVFERTKLEFIVKNLHDEWTTPKGRENDRNLEIETWLKLHGKSERILILDDDHSGWSLQESALHKRGCVVLCSGGVGFVADKLEEAQQALLSQFPMDPAEPKKV